MAKAKTPRISNSNKQVIPMPEAGSTPTIRKSASPSNPTPIDLESQIRQRAYELYVERGYTPGQENDDWLRAESEVRARQHRQQSA